jgi:hypothetical protein
MGSTNVMGLFLFWLFNLYLSDPTFSLKWLFSFFSPLTDELSSVTSLVCLSTDVLKVHISFVSFFTDFIEVVSTSSRSAPFCSYFLHRSNNLDRFSMAKFCSTMILSLFSNSSLI